MILKVVLWGNLFVIYVSNEPKSALVQDLGDYRDNVRNSRSGFRIVLLQENMH